MNLINVLNNQSEIKKLRDERSLTLEKLQEKNITIQDCKNLFSYSKVLYEGGQYKEAEKYLYALKEILVKEQA